MFGDGPDGEESRIRGPDIFPGTGPEGHGTDRGGQAAITVQEIRLKGGAGSRTAQERVGDGWTRIPGEVAFLNTSGRQRRRPVASPRRAESSVDSMIGGLRRGWASRAGRSGPMRSSADYWTQTPNRPQILGLITPGDVLARMDDFLRGSAGNLADLLRAHVVRELHADHLVHLDQAGARDDQGLALPKVAVTSPRSWPAGTMSGHRLRDQTRRPVLRPSAGAQMSRLVILGGPGRARPRWPR